MRGSSTGGTDFLTMSIKALHPHLSIGAVTMAIDLIIILIGWPVYGNPDAVLYGLISTFVTSTVIDKIMYGTSAGKLAIIITTQGPAMATHIDEVCARGSTLIRAKVLIPRPSARYCSVPAPRPKRTRFAAPHIRPIRTHLS